MKTRIKVVEQGGITFYYPQVRQYLFWTYICVEVDSTGRSEYHTEILEKAKREIDSYLGRGINLPTKVSFIDYPTTEGEA